MVFSLLKMMKFIILNLNLNLIGLSKDPYYVICANTEHKLIRNLSTVSLGLQTQVNWADPQI